MSRLIDLTGQKFHYLTVIEYAGSNQQGNALWKCICDCGKECIVRGIDLRKEHTKSCGCYRPPSKMIDLTGQRFGKWTVLHQSDNPNKNINNRHIYWKCQCDCGTIRDIDGTSLRNGGTKSCGCIRSLTEILIANILKKNNINFKSQYVFNDLRGKKNNFLRFDFGILDQNNKLIGLIEFQGELHEKPYNNNNDKSFQRQLECDQMKRDYCQKNKIPLCEINYRDRDKIDWEYINNIIQNMKIMGE